MSTTARPGRAEAALRAFALGEYRVALSHATQVLHRDPNHARMLVCAGESLVQLGEEQAGLALFRRTIRSHPTNTDALAGASNALRLLGDADGALAHAELALGLDPRSVTAARAKAAILRTSGRAGEAAAFFEPFHARSPEDPTAACEWADLCRATGRHEEGVAALERAARRPALAPAARRTLCYRMAHLLDELERHDEAFEAVSRANPAPTRDAVVPAEAVMRMWPSRMLGAIPRPEPAGPTPVLVVGMPRSGTTLTDRMLSAHPEVGSVGESPMLGEIAREAHQLRRPPDAGWATRQSRRYTGMLQSRCPGARAVIDKMPGNFMNLGIAARLLPGVRVVHCVRDVRDVCLSCYFQDFSAKLEFTRDLVQCARQCVAKDRLMDHWKKTLDVPVLDLPYERLVRDTEAAVRGVLGFLGLGFDEACLAPERARRHETTASWSRVEGAITGARVGRWKRYERHLGPMLAWLDDHEGAYG